MKICTKCERSLPLTSFGKGNDKLGLHYKCKECLKKYRDSRAKEIVQYRAEHILDTQSRDAAYYKEHANHKRAKTTQWRLDNPDKRRLQQSKRRSMILGATVEPMPANIWSLLLDFYGVACMYPGCINTDLTLDHVVPLTKSGEHAVYNFQILCSSHNSSKGNYRSTDYRPKDDLGRPIILQNF